MIPRSAVSGISWPALPPESGALLLAIQHQLQESEWLPADEFTARQFEALGAVLQHACATVPYYRESEPYRALAAAGPLDAETWASLPILTRPAVQDAGPALVSDSIPSDHFPLNEATTSGSSGRPVKSTGTRVTALFWSAITLRDHAWHERDLGAKLASIRAEGSDSWPREGLDLRSWGPAVDAAYHSGPCALLSIQNPVPAQAEWLVKHDPDYLLSYPSNLMALAQHFQANGARLERLREVRTYGEMLTPAVRAACREAWDVPVTDLYSSQELGYIGLQCPRGDWYHVQAESLLVEVLDEEGRPCGPGQVGRVVASTLHNYAMPFFRYELGDYAEVGDDCVCGRTLPVLSRLMGRQRNMLTLPTGQKVWPTFPVKAWGHLEAIRQLQLVQVEVDHIQARIVGPRPLSPDEESEFAAMLRRRFAYDFRVSFDYLDHVDRGAAMKFEDFVSLTP